MDERPNDHDRPDAVPHDYDDSPCPECGWWSRLCHCGGLFVNTQ